MLGLIFIELVVIIIVRFHNTSPDKKNIIAEDIPVFLMGKCILILRCRTVEDSISTNKIPR